MGLGFEFLVPREEERQRENERVFDIGRARRTWMLLRCLF